MGPKVWACWDNLSKVKKELLYVTFSINWEEAEHLVGLFGFWRQHMPHMGIQLQDFYWETQTTASLSGSLRAL